MSNARAVLITVNKYLCYFTVSRILTTWNSRSHLVLVPVTVRLATDTLPQFILTDRMAVLPVTGANVCPALCATDSHPHPQKKKTQKEADDEQRCTSCIKLILMIHRENGRSSRTSIKNES